MYTEIKRRQWTNGLLFLKYEEDESRYFKQ